MSLAAIIQIIIGLLGPLALFLSLAGKRSGLWLCALIQPFWIWISITNSLWGVLVVSILYLLVQIYYLAKKTC